MGATVRYTRSQGQMALSIPTLLIASLADGGMHVTGGDVSRSRAGGQCNV